MVEVAEKVNDFHTVKEDIESIKSFLVQLQSYLNLSQLHTSHISIKHENKEELKYQMKPLLTTNNLWVKNIPKVKI
jgi:hypothetical protein